MKEDEGCAGGCVGDAVRSRFGRGEVLGGGISPAVATGREASGEEGEGGRSPTR